MAYNNNIPQPTDQINQSQAQLLGNFQALSTALIGVNTAGLLATNQASDPATAANQVAIYARVPQNSGSVPTPTSVMALRQPSSGNVVEFSDFEINTFDGWTRLPSGVLIKWYLVSIPADSSGDISKSYLYTWPVRTNYPAFTGTPYIFQLAPVFPGAATYIGTTTIFVVNNANATTFNLRVESASSLGGWATFNCCVTAFGPG